MSICKMRLRLRESLSDETIWGRISEAKREELELRTNGDRRDGKDGRKGDEDGERVDARWGDEWEGGRGMEAAANGLKKKASKY